MLCRLKPGKTAISRRSPAKSLYPALATQNPAGDFRRDGQVRAGCSLTGLLRAITGQRYCDQTQCDSARISGGQRWKPGRYRPADEFWVGIDRGHLF